MRNPKLEESSQPPENTMQFRPFEFVFFRNMRAETIVHSERSRLLYTQKSMLGIVMIGWGVLIGSMFIKHPSIEAFAFGIVPLLLGLGVFWQSLFTSIYLCDTYVMDGILLWKGVCAFSTAIPYEKIVKVTVVQKGYLFCRMSISTKGEDATKIVVHKDSLSDFTEILWTLRDKIDKSAFSSEALAIGSIDRVT